MSRTQGELDFAQKFFKICYIQNTIPNFLNEYLKNQIFNLALAIREPILL